MDISASFVNEPVLCHTHEEHCSREHRLWSGMNGMRFMINNMESLLSFLSRKIDLFPRVIRNKRKGDLNNCEGNWARVMGKNLCSVFPITLGWLTTAYTQSSRQGKLAPTRGSSGTLESKQT